MHSKPKPWSVDSIHLLPSQEELLVRLLKYHDDPSEPVGLRYLRAHPLTRASRETGRGPKLLDFGRAFLLPWADITERDGRVRLTPDNQESIERDESTEKVLSDTISKLLRDAPPPKDVEVEPTGKRVVRIDVLKVGQGDTILVQLAPKEFWLIDAYSWHKSTYSQLQQEIRDRGCSKLSGLVLSHFHDDHIRRVPQIVSDFDPTVVVVPDHQHLTAVTRNALLAAGGRLRKLKGSCSVSVGSDCHLVFAATSQFATTADPNKHGIVGYCITPESTAFLAADAPASILKQVIHCQSWQFTRPKNYYKVTHHCSETGRDEALLELLHPALAATSCGLKNKHGHPEPVTRELIDNRYSHLVTSEYGTVSFIL